MTATIVKPTLGATSHPTASGYAEVSRAVLAAVNP